MAQSAEGMTHEPGQQLPPREEDPLSLFLADAAFNERASSLNLSGAYSLLKQVHATLKCAAAAIEKHGREDLLAPHFLFIRAHSAFLAAVRLTLGGQAFEATVVLRAAIELTWYALHIAQDPKPPTRGLIWLQRHHSRAALQKCKNEFTVANVRATHEGLDPATAGVLRKLYDTTIDFGGHPNEKGILASMKSEKTKDAILYQVGILHPEPLLMSVTLKMAVEAAIGILKVGQLILPKQLKVEGLELTIEQLIREVPLTFAGTN